jgi:hypothetical protein
VDLVVVTVLAMEVVVAAVGMETVGRILDAVAARRLRTIAVLTYLARLPLPVQVIQPRLSSTMLMRCRMCLPVCRLTVEALIEGDERVADLALGVTNSID